MFGFTDHDVDLLIGGVRYYSSAGYTASAMQASNDLSTSNMEIDALLLAAGGAVTQQDIEGGVWANAAVLIFGVNYADLSMGQINLAAGNLGQFSIANGGWKVEIRGLAQVMQQTIGDQFSPTCRAVFGDGRCKITPPAFDGAVGSVSVPGLIWYDPTLGQVGPMVPYKDSIGHIIPTAAPYQVRVVAPSGSFAGNTSVIDKFGSVWQIGTGKEQYEFDSTGLYTFNSNDAGAEVFISFTYNVGYFAYGNVRWTTGANAGLTSDVKQFAPGVITLALPVPNAIQPGDEYVITAGCDKQFGTCQTRWNNIVNFRGEPYVPGPDTLLAPQG
ncbi:putative phage protein (TIGR02218 family) [Paraburkholderia caballeronis]|nr:putative phage protein (TIGR02218 family) [Paraburkholderia caballeronis]TDV07936.1 putative phage protein (TIGR02218 family) [Paraburkholderia caballeronis]TDV18227.1 putative phage protein (TIGR02218 family) [Paraburkholderia caballeronis]